MTGKGGVGKTTVAVAAARAAADAGERVLLVETASPGRLGAVLACTDLGHEPRGVAPGVDAVAIDDRRAFEALVERLMPLRPLSRRLLSSETFRVLAHAVPGILEAARLTQIAAWLDGRELGRGSRYDRLVVDAPASGHSVPMLASPGTLSGLAAMGPLGEALRRTARTLRDPARTRAWVVSLPEDWAVAEALELYRALEREIGLPLAAPILNAVFPRRFSRAEEEALDRAAGALDERLLRAGRYFASRRRAAGEQIRRLRAATRARPIELPYLFSERMAWEDLAPLAAALRPALGAAGS